jgi:O-antigen/teichoic acid export membrane protein
MSVKIIRNQFHAIVNHIRIPLYTNAYALILLQVSVSILGFLFWVIATRTNKPGEIGTGTALLSASLLIVSLSNLGFDDGLTYFLPRSTNQNALINTSFCITLSLSGMLALLYLIGIPIWSPKLGSVLDTPITFLTFITCVILLQLSAMQDGLFIADRISKYALFKGITTNLLRIPFFLLLVFFSIGIWDIILSASLALLVGIIFSQYFYINRQRISFEFVFPKVSRELRLMSRFSFGNYLSNFIVGLPTTILPLIIFEKLGTEANAYFYIAWIIGGMIGVIGRSFGTSLFVESSHDQPSLERNIWRSFRSAVLIVIPAVIGLSLIAKDLLLFLGKDYGENSTTLVIWFALSSIPLTIHGISIGVLKAKGKIKELVWAGTFFAVLHIVLTLSFVTYWGLPGVGWAIVLARSLSAFLTVLLAMSDEKNSQKILFL